MANYDEIKKKAKDALETIADVSVEAYKIAEEKAKMLAKRAKLNAEIAREKSTIRRLKLDIGGAYYDLHNSDPEDVLKQNCDGITSSLDSIAAKRRELEDLKRGCKCEDADFDAESDSESEPEPEPEPEPESEPESKIDDSDDW